MAKKVLSSFEESKKMERMTGCGSPVETSRSEAPTEPAGENSILGANCAPRSFAVETVHRNTLRKEGVPDGFCNSL